MSLIATFTTSRGPIRIKLHADKAPVTVASFVNLVQRGDNSRLAITVEGIDYLEQHYQTHRQQRRLKAASAAVQAPAATVA